MHETDVAPATDTRPNVMHFDAHDAQSIRRAIANLQRRLKTLEFAAKAQRAIQPRPVSSR